jgi:hypothetical protein
VITNGFAALFGLPDRVSHAAMIAVLTITVVGIRFLIGAIAVPFRRDAHVRPPAMEQVLDSGHAMLRGFPDGAAP